MKRERHNARKWVGVIMVAVVVSFPVLVVAYHWAADVVVPVTVSSLAVAPVELGQLLPGEERAIECELRNCGARVLRLDQPRVSCGCVSLNNGPSVLQSGETRTLRFTYEAPTSPHEVNEAIVLQAVEFPSVVWKIKIHGQVLADVWATPGKVALMASEAGYADAFVQIHHNAGTPLGDVRIDSSAIVLDSVSDGDGVRVVRLSVSPSLDRVCEAGYAMIHVMAPGSGKATLLKIPVTWRPAQKLKWIPAKVLLTGYGASTEELRRTLLVSGLAGEDIRRLRVAPLEQWVRIEWQSATGNLVELHLAFDPSRMPQQIDQGILRLCVDDGSCETVRAYGRRLCE